MLGVFNVVFYICHRSCSDIRRVTMVFVTGQDKKNPDSNTDFIQHKAAHFRIGSNDTWTDFSATFNLMKTAENTIDFRG